MFLRYLRLLTSRPGSNEEGRETRHALSSRGNKGSTMGRSVDQRDTSSSHPFRNARTIASRAKAINYTDINLARSTL